MLTLPDQYTQVQGMRTRYWKAGEGPVVLLLHGGTEHVEYWGFTIPALLPHFRVIALDFPGHGRTDKPLTFQYDLASFASFIKDFLDGFQIKKTHLVGHSLGGAIANQVAVRYPEVVDRLVLVDAGFFGKEIALPLRLLGIPLLGKVIYDRAFPADFNTFKKRAGALATLIEDDILQRAWEIGRLLNAREAFLKLVRNITWPWGVKKSVYLPILNSLASIQCPTLIVWGKQDSTVPSSHALEAAKRIPNARLELMDNCGHGPFLDQPEAFNRILVGFLKGQGVL